MLCTKWEIKDVSALNKILKKGKKELMEMNKLRENSQKNMRETLRLSKQAILSIHQKKFLESKNES